MAPVALVEATSEKQRLLSLPHPGRRSADLRPAWFAIDEFRPDLVVNEFCEFGAPIAAARHGVPCVTHALGLPMPEGLMAEAGHQIARVWESYGLPAPRYGGMLELAYIDPCPASLNPRDGAPCARLPIALSQARTPARARSRPFVYVTLGTAAVFNRSGDLWRTVLDAVSGLDVDVLATIGRANDPGELGEVPANVTVEQWRDQDEVLPDCSAVICHGGAGTMFGALAYGVPLLVLPQGADQFRNADAVKEARARTTCDGSDATAIRAAVESLLHDGSYVKGARRIATELAVMPSASEVVHALDEIVAASLGG